MSDIVLTAANITLTLRNGIVIEKRTPLETPGLPVLPDASDGPVLIETFDPLTGLETGKTISVGGAPGPTLSPFVLVASTESTPDRNDAERVQSISYFDSQGNTLFQDLFGSSGVNVRQQFFPGSDAVSQIQEVDTQDTKNWIFRTQVNGPDGSPLVRFRLDDRLIETVEEFDPETGQLLQLVRFDFGNVRSWETQTETYDSTGLLATRVTEQDDGGSVLETFAEGVRVARDITDGPDGGTRAWETINETYDAAGKLASRSTLFDNGGTRVTELVDGQRVSDVEVDGGNRSWSERATEWDESGNLLSKTTVFDDGRIDSTIYEGGVRAVETKLDLGDAKSWTSWETLFDDDGKLAFRQVVMDDGRTIVSTFEAGVRSSRIETDWEDARSWTSRETLYDDEGRRAFSEDVFDNGVVRTVTWEDGILRSRTTEDLGDVFAWAERSEARDEKGDLISRSLLRDDGLEVITTFEDGVRDLQTEIDTKDIYDWSERITTYDDVGKVLSRVEIPDVIDII